MSISNSEGAASILLSVHTAQTLVNDCDAAVQQLLVILNGVQQNPEAMSDKGVEKLVALLDLKSDILKQLKAQGFKPDA